MKLAKAIEILEDLDKRGHFAPGDDVTPAIKLGIEALKTVRDMRHYPFPDGIVELPGETKE